MQSFCTVYSALLSRKGLSTTDIGSAVSTGGHTGKGVVDVVDEVISVLFVEFVSMGIGYTSCASNPCAGVDLLSL